MPWPMRTSSTRLWAWSAKLVADKIKKAMSTGLETTDLDDQRRHAKELGDVLRYVTAPAATSHALEDIATMNIDKLRIGDRDMIHGSMTSGSATGLRSGDRWPSRTPHESPLHRNP